jgi:L-2-hydroxycarboxylate dehydrogenase (NAD+)
MRTDVATAKVLSEELLTLAGVPAAAAAQQAQLLVAAEARGVRSHGLLRLPRLITRLRNGTASATRTGIHSWFSPTYLSVDGEQGLGPVVALAALDRIVPAAREHGIACVAITNNNHLGMLGWYAEQVAADGLVCIAATTSEALVHPWGGTEAIIGTNPISIGIPSCPRPLVLDMATSEVSMGKIHEYALRGQKLEEGWALDRSGEPTIDAEEAIHGSIAPFGGAKGYALGIALGAMVTAITGCAAGTAVAGTLDDVNPCNKGDMFVVIRCADAPISDYLDDVRSSRPADPQHPVTVPGDRSAHCDAKSRKYGFEVPDDLWNRLSTLRQELTADRS